MRAQWLGLVLVAAACGANHRGESGTDCTSVCTSQGFEQCHEDGTFDPPAQCAAGDICDPTLGCTVCVPDSKYCGGPTNNDVLQCDAEGNGGDIIASCTADQVCSDGLCKTPCEAALDHPSNVGCDFWAVDLDNEASTTLGVNSDSAAAQFAIIVANDQDYPVMVVVNKNTARVGQPIQEQTVVAVSVPPQVAQRIDLPQREVDGAMGQNGTYTANSGSGSFVSPHAYHVTTTAPVVIYQFNPVVQQYSNDASTLIPIQALGNQYIAVGFQTANPCGIDQFPIAGIPDHGSVAIVASQDDTHVTVETTHKLMATGGDSGFAIPATDKGGTAEFTLGRFTVVNLETEQYKGSAPGCASAVNAGQNGDLTGTFIRSDKPIAVFTASERGLGFGGAENVDYPPDWDMANDDICCTDHLEEQLFPVTALGREFAISRSPIRSTYSNWVEQDIFRVVGSADDTTITTNLPAPYNAFTLQAREQKTFMARDGFTLSADKAVQIAQYLVPQQFIKQGFIGDPSQVMFPAVEQHRKDYVFLVPASWRDNYVVYAKPVAADVKLDGASVQGEGSICVTAPIGSVNLVDYEQVTCKVTEGRHTSSSDQPFGLTVYGYFSVGSYAFVGGSDVKIINPVGRTY